MSTDGRLKVFLFPCDGRGLRMLCNFYFKCKLRRVEHESQGFEYEIQGFSMADIIDYLGGLFKDLEDFCMDFLCFIIMHDNYYSIKPNIESEPSICLQKVSLSSLQRAAALCVAQQLVRYHGLMAEKNVSFLSQ